MYRARAEAVNGLQVFADGKWLTCIGNKNVRVGDYVWTDGRCVYGFNKISQQPMVITQQSENKFIPIVLYDLKTNKLFFYAYTKSGMHLENETDNVVAARLYTLREGGHLDTIIQKAEELQSFHGFITYNKKGNIYRLSPFAYTDVIRIQAFGENEPDRQYKIVAFNCDDQDNIYALLLYTETYFNFSGITRLEIFKNFNRIKSFSLSQLYTGEYWDMIDTNSYSNGYIVNENEWYYRGVTRIQNKGQYVYSIQNITSTGSSIIKEGNNFAQIDGYSKINSPSDADSTCRYMTFYTTQGTQICENLFPAYSFYPIGGLQNNEYLLAAKDKGGETKAIAPGLYICKNGELKIFRPQNSSDSVYCFNQNFKAIRYYENWYKNIQTFSIEDFGIDISKMKVKK